MTRRQPEIGSALGLTTDEVVARCDRRLAYLRAVRADLVSELATAIDNLNEGVPPIDVAIRLHRSADEPKVA